MRKWIFLVICLALAIYGVYYYLEDRFKPKVGHLDSYIIMCTPRGKNFFLTNLNGIPSFKKIGFFDKNYSIVSNVMEKDGQIWYLGDTRDYVDIVCNKQVFYRIAGRYGDYRLRSYKSYIVLQVDDRIILIDDNKREKLIYNHIDRHTHIQLMEGKIMLTNDRDEIGCLDEHGFHKIKNIPKEKGQIDVISFIGGENKALIYLNGSLALWDFTNDAIEPYELPDYKGGLMVIAVKDDGQFAILSQYAKDYEPFLLDIKTRGVKNIHRLYVDKVQLTERTNCFTNIKIDKY